MNRITIILFIAATVIAGCSRPGIKGDGEIKTEDRSISDYSKIVVSGGYKITWSIGKPALNISADQNLLPLIKTVVSGNTLQIDSTEQLAPTESIKIILSSASLANVRLKGGNSFRATKISGHDLKIESIGASNIRVDGSVTNLEANLTGASRLNAKSLHTQTATLSLLGASDADVNVTDALKVSVTGAGSLIYSGNPKSVEQTIAGEGSIRHLP
jgi:hypothetical protein